MTIKLKTEDGNLVAFGSITASYTDVGSATGNALSYVGVINGTDAAVYVSLDGGETDGLPLPSYSAVGLSGKDFEIFNRGVAQLPKGSQFKIKHSGSAPTVGAVSIIRGYSS